MSSTLMSCPDAGRWRAWLDDQADNHALLAEHLAGCGTCRRDVDELRATAAAAAASLGALAPRHTPDGAAVALAHARLLAHQGAAPGPAAIHASPAERANGRVMRLLRARQMALGGLAAAVALTFLVGFTPQGQALAAQFLAQFRSQRFAVVTVPTEPGQMGSFQQLERLGTVSTPSAAKSPETVASIAEASRRVGFAVKQPDASRLPQGLSPQPRIQVMPGGEVRFTFDRDRAREYFKSIGRTDVSMPDTFHGATLVVNLPNAVLLDYSVSSGSGSQRAVSASAGSKGAQPAPAASKGELLPTMLVVGQSGELTAGVEGKPSLAELREFLLGLPGLPPDTVRQLRAIDDWTATVPIFLPAENLQWKETTIAGARGLLLSEGSGLGSAAIWQRDGRVYGVLGTLRAQDVQQIAESLR
jgi:hypothetical protein